MENNQSQEEPVVIKIETTAVKEFSFKKLAVGWGIVVGIIVCVAMLVDYLVYGW